MSTKQSVTQLPTSPSQGFSLIELMVTVTIITLITALVMVKYSSFDSSILLNNQAFELALDIRETQVRSISVQAGTGGSDVFSSNYGLYFDKGNTDEYILFQDLTEQALLVDGRFDEGAEEIGAPFTFDPRFVLNDIYVNNNPSITVNNASIIFQRPNFDARFGFSAPPGGSVSSVHIVIASVRDPSSKKTVSVYNSGLITVE